MRALPRGTVTFLFTDVHGSTELVKRLGVRYGSVLARHQALLRSAFAEHAGIEVDTQGDAFFVAFERARNAVDAAAAAQRALVGYAWGEAGQVLVRIGLHTGEAFLDEDRYVGVAVNRAARICTIAHGGQVLLSRSTAGIVDDEEIAGVMLRDLGEHPLKDFPRPERVFQLVLDGLPSEFPPLPSVDQQPPLAGTVTVVQTEGRRVMRLSRELPPEQFGVLLTDYQQLLRNLFEEMGGQSVEAVGDTAWAAFSTAKQAAFAAAAAQRAVEAHAWPNGLEVAISVGMHSGQAGIGRVGPAVIRCADLCDAAEGGQVFMSQATAGLLEDEEIRGLEVRDIGEVRTRRTDRPVHAYELVRAPRDTTPPEISASE
jgi:class 3 adenylate cyclase